MYFLLVVRFLTKLLWGSLQIRIFFTALLLRVTSLIHRSICCMYVCTKLFTSNSSLLKYLHRYSHLCTNSRSTGLTLGTPKLLPYRNPLKYPLAFWQISPEHLWKWLKAFWLQSKWFIVEQHSSCQVKNKVYLPPDYILLLGSFTTQSKSTSKTECWIFVCETLKDCLLLTICNLFFFSWTHWLCDWCIHTNVWSLIVAAKNVIQTFPIVDLPAVNHGTEMQKWQVQSYCRMQI